MLSWRVKISSKSELLSWDTFSLAVKSLPHVREVIKELKSCHEHLVNSFVLCCLVNLYKWDYLLSNSSIVTLLPLSVCGSRSKAKVTKMSASEKQHFIQLHDVIISAHRTELKYNTGKKCRWRKDSKRQGALKKKDNKAWKETIFLLHIKYFNFGFLACLAITWWSS